MYLHGVELLRHDGVLFPRQAPLLFDVGFLHLHVNRRSLLDAQPIITNRHGVSSAIEFATPTFQLAETELAVLFLRRFGCLSRASKLQGGYHSNGREPRTIYCGATKGRAERSAAW